MVKKTPPGNLWGDLSWALDCVVTGISKSTEKPAPECEMELLQSLAQRAYAMDRIPRSEYKTIGEILFKSLNENQPCSPFKNPDSVRAELPEELRLKFRLKKEMNQAEYLVFVDSIGSALIVKAWLKRDPVEAGKAWINREHLMLKALHGAFVESRIKVLWDKRIKNSNTNKVNVKVKHDKYSKKKDELLKIWASGKYTTREICAEEEYNSLGVSFGTARKWLINSSNPKSNT